MYLRSKKKAAKEISLYEPIGTDREGNEIKLYDIIETDEEEVAEKIHLKENIQTLYEKVEKELSQRERIILKCVTDSITEKNIRSGKLQDNLEFPVLMSHESKKGLWRNYGNLFHDFKNTYIHVTKLLTLIFGNHRKRQKPLKNPDFVSSPSKRTAYHQSFNDRQFFCLKFLFNFIYENSLVYSVCVSAI